MKSVSEFDNISNTFARTLSFEVLSLMTVLSINESIVGAKNFQYDLSTGEIESPRSHGNMLVSKKLNKYTDYLSRRSVAINGIPFIEFTTE